MTEQNIPEEQVESAVAGAVMAAVRGQRDQMLALLERLVLCESPSSDGALQGPVFDLLEEALADIGYEVKRLAGVTSGGQLLAAPVGSDFAGIDLESDAALPAAEVGQPALVQVLMGHCDTVWPVGTLEDMPLHIDDQVARGPGIFDMKAGLAQTVFALRALESLDLQPSITPVVFINSDEEIGSPDSASRIERLAHRAARVFVMEPALGSEGKLKTARRGVGQFEVTITGKAAHAGLDPEAGASAILEMSHQIQRLFDFNDPERGVGVNVGIIRGGLRPNVIAPESTAVVDVRVPDGIEAERVSAGIRDLVAVTKGVQISVSGAVDRAPMERTPRNQALWRQADRCARELGLSIEQGVSGGASDGNFTSLSTATLDGLGAVGDGAHAAHEFIDVPRSVERCALLAMLIMSPEADDETTE